MTTIARVLSAALTDEVWERLDVRRAKQQTALIKRGWPPPFALPVRVFDEVTQWAADETLSNTEFDESVIGVFTPSMCESILSGWKRNPLLADRVHLVEEVMQLYVGGFHSGAIALLLPQIEGVLANALHRRPNAQNDARLVFRESRLSDVAKEFYLKVAKSTLNWGEREPIQTLSRNEILHGLDVGFGTAANALKCILLFDAVQDGALEYSVKRTDQEQDDLS